MYVTTPTECETSDVPLHFFLDTLPQPAYIA